MEIIDKATDRLLDRSSPYRQKAEKLLPIVTGYDGEMIRLGLTSYLKTFRKHELQRFLVEDLGNPLLLDDFQPASKRWILKSNWPRSHHSCVGRKCSGIASMEFRLGSLSEVRKYRKSIKFRASFSGWFAQALVEVEPRLSNCFAVVWWKGGDEEREKLVFEQSNLVIGYGGNQSLQSLRSRIPITTRFLPFGHKVSFGMVSSAALDSQKAWRTAHGAALDVVRYDQQGCYSPHLFYVQKGGKVAPREFARYLATELDNFEKRYPRRGLHGRIDKLSFMATKRRNERLFKPWQRGA